MRFSQQVHYAVCGLFDLAYNAPGTAAPVRVIGERQRVPSRYLEQIFQRLRRAGLVSSKRGPGGGYRLTRTPREITLCQVIEAVEGPVRNLARPLEAPPVGSEPDAGATCGPDFVWEEVAESFVAILEGITLEDLCDRAARTGVPRAGADSYTYQI